MKRLLIIVSIIFGIGIIAACTGGGTVDSNKAEKVSDSTSAEETEKPETDKIFKINEDIKLNDTILTINKIEKTSGSEYERKEGIEYIIVSVKLKNAGKERIDYNPFDFKLENSKGNIKDNTYISNVQLFESGQLAPNGEVSGRIVFEAPVGDPKLTLEYQPNWLEDQVIKVGLN